MNMENKSKNIKEMVCFALDGVMTQYYDGSEWRNNLDYPQGAVNNIMVRPHVYWRKRPPLK